MVFRRTLGFSTASETLRTTRFHLSCLSECLVQNGMRHLAQPRRALFLLHRRVIALTAKPSSMDR